MMFLKSQSSHNPAGENGLFKSGNHRPALDERDKTNNANTILSTPQSTIQVNSCESSNKSNNSQEGSIFSNLFFIFNLI